MNYALDLDTVCFDFIGAFKKQIEEKYYTKIKNSDITRWYWNQCLPFISKESFDAEFDTFINSGGFRHLDAFVEARLAVQLILDAGHNLYFITNRPKSAIHQTYDSIAKFFPFFEFKKIIFSDRKSKDCEKLDIDVFVDDSAHHAIDVWAHTEAKVYMLKMPYNEMVSVDDPKFIKISSLYDFCIKENLL